MRVLYESELNKVIHKKLKEHGGSIGVFTEGETLPVYIEANMDQTIHELCETAKGLNKVFISKKNIQSGHQSGHRVPIHTPAKSQSGHRIWLIMSTCGLFCLF